MLHGFGLCCVYVEILYLTQRKCTRSAWESSILKHDSRKKCMRNGLFIKFNLNTCISVLLNCILF